METKTKKGSEPLQKERILKNSWHTGNGCP